MESIFQGGLLAGLALILYRVLATLLRRGTAKPAEPALGFDPHNDTLPILLASINGLVLGQFLVAFGGIGMLLLTFTPLPGFISGLLAVILGFAVAQLLVTQRSRQQAPRS